MTEDGSETGNVIERNFVLRSRGSGDNLRSRTEPDLGHEGSGFWFNGPNNIVRANVAANGERWGFYAENRTACDMQAAPSCIGARFPAFPGADPTVEEESAFDDNITRTPWPEFARNEAYGATTDGFDMYAQHKWGCAISGAGSDCSMEHGSTFRDLVVWHHSDKAFTGGYARWLTIDGIRVRGGSIGVEGGVSGASDWTIRRADIQGTGVGLITGYNTTLLVGSLLAGNRWDVFNHSHVVLPTPWRSEAGVVIRNSRLRSKRAIVMKWGLTHGNNWIALRDRLLVYDYNGDPEDDFQVFFREQAPRATVPATGVDKASRLAIKGCPKAGLTNQQCWKRYRIAVAGAVAPCTRGRPRITGIVCRVPPARRRG